MRIIILSLIGLFLGWLRPPTLPDAPPGQENTLLVALEEDVSMEQVLQNSLASIRSARKPDYLQLAPSEPYYLIRPLERSIEWRTRLARHPGVRLVQINHPVAQREKIPGDPYWEEQWNLQRIGLPAVWERSATPPSPQASRQVVVGILEKHGFDLAHPDLEAQIWTNPLEIPGDQRDNDHNGLIDDWQGWNFFTDSPEHPVDHHGTKVAGIIAAGNDNDIGISGFGTHTRFIPVSGLHYEHQIVQAYLYLRDLRRRYNQSDGQQGAFVVATNASFGVNYGQPADYPIWCEVFDKLGAEGILSVSSVMNAPEDIDQVNDIPTSCTSDFLITVTESDYEDTLPPDVAYGRQSVDLAAPGRGSFTTFPHNRYGTVNRGTSFAAPHVSGTIALLYQNLCPTWQKRACMDPASTARQLKKWLLQGADHLPGLRQKVLSEGRLNAAHSYHLMQEACATTPQVSNLVARIFPNPFTDAIQVMLSFPQDAVLTFRLLDNTGREHSRLVQPVSAGSSVPLNLQFPPLPAGVYHLLVETPQGVDSIHRLVKLHAP